MIKIQSRLMRIIVMYDISFADEENSKKYNKFRTKLIQMGYFMIQYSIYVKCISSHTSYPAEKTKLLNIIPKESNIRMLLITESQYQNIEFLSGNKSLNEKYNELERYIKI